MFCLSGVQINLLHYLYFYSYAITKMICCLRAAKGEHSSWKNACLADGVRQEEFLPEYRSVRDSVSDSIELRLKTTRFGCGGNSFSRLILLGVELLTIIFFKIFWLIPEAMEKKNFFFFGPPFFFLMKKKKWGVGGRGRRRSFFPKNSKIRIRSQENSAWQKWREWLELRD